MYVIEDGLSVKRIQAICHEGKEGFYVKTLFANVRNETFPRHIIIQENDMK